MKYVNSQIILFFFFVFEVFANFLRKVYRIFWYNKGTKLEMMAMPCHPKLLLFVGLTRMRFMLTATYLFLIHESPKPSPLFDLCSCNCRPLSGH